MINLIIADMRSIKLISLFKLVPAVIVLAFFSNHFHIHPYYAGIALFTLGLCIESFSKQKKEGIEPLIISLPVTRKEYIAAKYLIIIPWFIIASIIMTVWILLIERDFNFFSMKYWLITLAITVIIAAYYFIVYQFSQAAALILFAAFISITISLNLPVKLNLISHHPIYLAALLISCISYIIVIIRFNRTNI